MALGAADIPSFIPDEATAQNAPYFFIGSGAGIRLQVAEEHVSEAQQIIRNSRPAHEEPKSEEKKIEQDEEEQLY
jgi:hypothetical protein